jgi:capsular polysaccharide export protein
LGGKQWTRPTNGKRVILVPGQVETDASIVYGAPEIRTNIDLVRAVLEANPKAYIVYKPHPDVVAGLRHKGELDHTLIGLCDEVLTDVSIHHLLNEVDEVHVMTSLTGFEAILRGRTVVTYGQPFYSGWALTVDKLTCERRTRKLSVTELVAGALILYPSYRDKSLDNFASPEYALERMLELQTTEVAFKAARAWVRRWVARLTTRRR